MMAINVLTVCVDYAEYFQHALPRWMNGAQSVTVVTTEEDIATSMLAVRYDKRLTVLTTDLFYRDGATFNKGRAMEWARKRMPFSDWILFVDADCVPPVDWPRRIEHANPECGYLYGCTRVCARPSLLDIPTDKLQRFQFDVPGVGFFQLFHSQDPIVTQSSLPLIETHWKHAGNYDNRFMDRWRNAGRRVRSIPLMELYHLGDRDNWHGKGNKQAFDAMMAERVRRGGRWDHEVIGSMPIDE